MKVLEEQNIKVLKIEYELDERNEMWDKLDEQYGHLKWRSVRSGPYHDPSKPANLGYTIIHVEVD